MNHPDRTTIDALAYEVLDDGEAVGPHVGSCPRCRRTLEAVRAEQDFLRRALRSTPNEAVGVPRRESRAGALSAGLPLAAAIALAVVLWFSARPEAPARSVPQASPGGSVPDLRPPDSAQVDDPYARAQRRFQTEFGSSRLIFHKAKPYLVALETSERFHSTMLCEDYGEKIQRVYAAFRREFADGPRLPEVEPALTVLVFNSRESFDRYFVERDKNMKRMSDSIKGIYEYDQERRRVVVYHDFDVPVVVLSHEGIHQLLHYYTLRETGGRRVPASYWFQEGLGTYFEALRGDSVDVAAGRDRLPTLKEALRPKAGGGRTFIPLNVLVAHSVDEFWQWFEDASKTDAEEATQKARLTFTESWALVHFLRNRSEKHRLVLTGYFRLETAGKGSKDAFDQLVREHLRTGLPELEEEFIAYLRDLK